MIKMIQAQFLKEFTKKLILNHSSNQENIKLPEVGELTELKEMNTRLAKENFHKNKLDRQKTPKKLKPWRKSIKKERKLETINPNKVSRNIKIKEISKTNKKPHRFDRNRLSSNFPSNPYQGKRVSPTPTNERIDLGKLNKLIKDKKVTSVECKGPNKEILVRVNGKTKISKIKLNQDEIKDIINRFSQKAKIPIIKGVFKAAVGELHITAIVSEVIGNKFIINKIKPIPKFNNKPINPTTTTIRERHSRHPHPKLPKKQ